MKRPDTTPLRRAIQCSDEEMRRRASAFRDVMTQQRTVRNFSDRPVLREVIEDALRAAGSAPSGANLQPRHFTTPA
jgi:hypothetical protein